MALNVAEPLVVGEYGTAAFDAVGPLILIGWSEVGPCLLQAIGTASPNLAGCDVDRLESGVLAKPDDGVGEAQLQFDEDIVVRRGGRREADGRLPEVLLALARLEDAAHRKAHQKPISADSLRIRLGVGAARARRLVAVVRSEFEARADVPRLDGGVAGETGSAAIRTA
ncbi:hypothetical protein [Actinocrispum wychmicini]|uniref:hypothetical protein n=1 Tax=Actinocrispum wychmicini TaxID=1213861 RepID=UPI00104A539B|nr:hypothetical protein [Actinocrispum wychmicini]